MTRSHKQMLKPNLIERGLNTTTRVDIYSPNVPPTMISTLRYKFTKMTGLSIAMQRVGVFTLPKLFRPYGKLKNLGEVQDFEVVAARDMLLKAKVPSEGRQLL